MPTPAPTPAPSGGRTPAPSAAPAASESPLGPAWARGPGPRPLRRCGAGPGCPPPPLRLPPAPEAPAAAAPAARTAPLRCWVSTRPLWGCPNPAAPGEEEEEGEAPGTANGGGAAQSGAPQHNGGRPRPPIRPPPDPPSRYDTHLVGLPVRPARPRALLAVLLTHVHHLRLGALPHQVPPHAGHVLKAVTCTGHGDAARGWARAAGAAVRRGAGGGEERPRTAGARAAPESAVVARAVPEGSEVRPRSPLGRHRRRFPLRAPGPARPAHRSGPPRPRRPPQTPPPPSDPTAAGARAPHALFM